MTFWQMEEPLIPMLCSKSHHTCLVNSELVSVFSMIWVACCMLHVYSPCLHLVAFHASLLAHASCSHLVGHWHAMTATCWLSPSLGSPSRHGTLPPLRARALGPAQGTSKQLLTCMTRIQACLWQMGRSWKGRAKGSSWVPLLSDGQQLLL